MKKKIAILLAAVMTTAAVPMTVMAGSSNSISKTVSVSVDDPIKGVYLKIQPNDAIETGDSIGISVEGGNFFDDDDYAKYGYAEQYEVTVNGVTYDWDKANSGNGGDKAVATQFIQKLSGTTNDLPYYIERNGKKEITVKLYMVPEELVGTKNLSTDSKIAYNIPLNIIAKSTGDVKVTIDANETSISGGGTYTIASATSSSGSTTTTVDELKTFEDYGYIKDISIKEDVKNTLKAGKEVTLRLSGGFVFSSKTKDRFKLYAGLNGDFEDVTACTIDDDELTFTLPSTLGTEDASGDREKAITLKIYGLVVEADDEDDDWGDVSLTVSGAGITRETIKIGERTDFGFKMTVLDEVPTLLAGRFEYGNAEGKSRVDDDDCEAAQIKFEETIPNTWLTQRKLEFSVPEGIQIYDAEIEDEENLNVGISTLAEITNDGTTLKIAKSEDLLSDSDDDTAEFKLKLYLSADADFSGEVNLSVAGGGVAADVVDDVVIANVITPITISATETKSNMGYQSVQTSDITITEAQEGVFLKDQFVVVALDASFGTDEIGFADEGIEAVIDGELEIKNFKVNDGNITFTIDKESYTAPSSITIKNVKVGTTRSVPYGDYDLTVGGWAVINNYDDDGNDYEGGIKWLNHVDDVAGETNTETGISTANDKADGFFDTTDTYSFKNYLSISTVTGTLDDVVKVTIGEKTILINDEAYDMDVAPYIQASSNSTMVPLRFVAVALGVDVNSINNPDESSKVAWNANTKTVTIYYGSGTGQKIIQFTADSNNMIVDGTTIPMDYGVVAEIKDDRMFVPFRALGQALGINVKWDADTRTATYNAE